MEPTTAANDPYPDNFLWPDHWSHETPLLADDECCDDGWLWTCDLSGNEMALECGEHRGR